MLFDPDQVPAACLLADSRKNYFYIWSQCEENRVKSTKIIFNRLLFLIILSSSLPLQAEQGDWLVRVRGIVVHPDDSSGLVSAGGVPLAGTGVEVDTQAVPEIDVTYMLHKHWGIEVIAGIAKHNVSFETAAPIAGLTDGFDLFDTWVLPPTVTLQYHFLPDNKIRPYLGFGVNYTAFLGDDATSELEALVGPVDVDTDHSWGLAGQVGVDIDFKDNWFFNVDVKYIDIDTTATLQTIPLGRLRVNVDVDPFVFGAGLGYRF